MNPSSCPCNNPSSSFSPCPYDPYYPNTYNPPPAGVQSPLVPNPPYHHAPQPVSTHACAYPALAFAAPAPAHRRRRPFVNVSIHSPLVQPVPFTDPPIVAPHVPYDTCALPGCNKPIFVDGGKKHDYCCRSHAAAHASGQPAPAIVNNQNNPQNFSHNKIYNSPYNQSFNLPQNQSFNPPQNQPLQPPLHAIGRIGKFFEWITERTAIFLKSTPTPPPVILFYNSYEPYYEFSNFYRAEFLLAGKKWSSTEHYFQAMKFKGTFREDEVQRLPSAREAFHYSRTHAAHVRADWHVVKDRVMLEALQAKFTQNEHLRHLLAGTGEATLVEHTDKDNYWGDGGDGTGENRLGIFLMQVRENIKGFT